jgi:16S rRNA (guanine966-N2)-methyltransferase
MKVTSGWAKNLTLLTPTGTETRPTRTRIREAVLSILQFDLQDKVVIDGFAGSGAMGIEMVSRGAKACLFVDQGEGALKVLDLNLRGLKERARSAGLSTPKVDSFKGDLMSLSSSWPAGYAEPDILWLDPPYELVSTWLSLFLARPSLYPAKSGMVILEHRSSDTTEINDLFQKHPSFKLKKLKKYGETSIVFMERLN